VTAKNHIQQQILDKLKAGEERIYYHPQSIVGGEVIDMRDRGLISVYTSASGYNYITSPQEQESENLSWYPASQG
jgi:hypothetical protein